MSKVTYPSISPESIIDIQVSGGFYQQIVSAMMALANTRSQEDFKKALESIKADGPSKDYYDLTIVTLTALIYEIEAKAKAQDKLKMVTVDPEAGEGL